MANPKVDPKNKRGTNIIELDLPFSPAQEGRALEIPFKGLNNERFPAKEVLMERLAGSRSEKTPLSLAALEIRHPLITFISELTQALSESSDQCLRPSSTIGINQVARKEIDFGSLLISLEAGEKRLNLLSHSKSTLDPLNNMARHMAHDAAFSVRALRRNLISTSSDPAHPGEQRASSMLESIDNLSYKLHEMRLHFEDLAAGLFVEASLGRHE